MLNGEEKGKKVKVKEAYFHEEYKKKSKKEVLPYDIGVMELEEDLENDYGFLGIDTRKENLQIKEKIEVYGYPSGQKNRLCFGEGDCKGLNEDLLLYSVPTKVGQSGGPVIRRDGDKEYVIGVHVAGLEELKKNAAVRLNQEKRKIINEWVGEITGELYLGKLVFILDQQELGDESMEELQKRWSEKLVSLSLSKFR